MNSINDIFSIDLDPQVVAGLIGILSMIVARLLDWYFPSKHHRHLEDDEDDDSNVKHVGEEDNE